MSFLIAIQYGNRTYMAGPTHRNGVPFGYSHIITPNSGTYMMGVLTLPENVSKLNKSPLIINDDITIKNFYDVIITQMSFYHEPKYIISKAEKLFKVENGGLNTSDRFVCVGDRSIYGSLHATDRFEMKPEERIKLALETIGESKFEIVVY